jgi:hypothetical protein
VYMELVVNSLLPNTNPDSLIKHGLMLFPGLETRSHYQPLYIEWNNRSESSWWPG